MDDFCGNGSLFWDDQLTWNTTKPDFTKCFEETVLVWIPSGFLFFLAVFELADRFRSKGRRIPASLLFLAKAVGTWALIALHVVHLSLTFSLEKKDYDIFRAERYATVLRIATYLLVFLLTVMHKAKGVRSSGLLFLYWLLALFCDVFSFQSNIRHPPSDGDEKMELYQKIHLIHYPLVVIMFLLNCWADRAPVKDAGEKVTNVLPCPETESSFLSKMVFFWFEGLARLGFKRPLENKDLWDLNIRDTSRYQVPRFDKNWNGPAEGRQIGVGGTKAEGSVLVTITKAFGPTFLFAAVLKLVQDLMNFVSPEILKLLIAFVKDPHIENWKGFLYVIVMFGTAVLQTIFLAQYFHVVFLVSMRLKTTLTSAVYRKALRISNTARKESTVGEIVNLMSVDIQKIMDTTLYLNMLWSAPLQIGLSLYFLWAILGPSVLAGVLVMVLLIPVNGVIAGRVRKLQIQQMKNKDSRVKMMSEILSGIKILKLYAWEPSFEQQVMAIRGKEMNVLKKAAYLHAGTSFVWACAPFVVSLVTFATYVLIDENNVLDAEKAFVSLTLFNIMKMPMTVLPMMVVAAVEASVATKRLNKFLNAEEIDKTSVREERPDSQCDPVEIENGSFSWDQDTPCLENVNMKVKEGSLIAIVGVVGSGKSSLLSAILGEMIKTHGTVRRRGKVAYVAQQAWIQNCSLKDNVLFNEEFDEAKYKEVIDACALRPDLEILPAGDRTEIGEKGVNLSGGQKQRVSLARAAYSKSDLFLLDDTLSAVDAHVGKHIFDNVLGPNGILKRTTRILVTHGITYLPQVDHIVVMKDGKISEEGTYKELMAKKGAFADFLVHHMTEVEEEEEYTNVLQELEQALGGKEKLLERQQSQISADNSETAEGSLRKRRVSTASTGSGSKVPLLKRAGSVVKKEDTPIRSASIRRERLIEAEKAETGSVKKDVYLHYFKAIGYPMGFITIFLNLIYQGVQVGSSVWLSKWSSDTSGVNGTLPIHKRNMYLGVYGALGLALAVSVMVGTVVMSLAMLKAASALHNIMLSHVLKSPMSFFDTTPLGRIVNRFSKDVDVVDNTLPHNMRSWIQCLFTVLATLLIISISTPWFIAAIVPLAVVYYLITKFYVATSRQLKRLESVSRSPIYSHFNETLTGATTIRAYGMQHNFIKDSEEKVDFNQKCYFPSIVANRWLAVRLETIGNLMVFFAGLFAVLGRDELEPGTVGLSVSYALQITQTLNWLVRMTSEVETNAVAIERIKEYGETEQEAEWEIPERKPVPTWPEKGMITFDRYQTRYREGLDLVLRNVTCVVEPGEKVGIVGRTGAGKSSLTMALFRIIEPTGGFITIDGQNIMKLGLHDVRGRITIIPQDPVLFSGTMRLNLDPFNKYSDEEIWRALELAHLKTFVSELPTKLTHEISEGGENLSVGQRQLVCLARAVLRKTRILVLDEATAAVDLETDDLIQKTIREEFKDCTVLTIAHRLNTIMDSTRVMVLDKGEVREFDSPPNLLKDRKSIFYGMAKDAGIV